MKKTSAEALVYHISMRKKIAAREKNNGGKYWKKISSDHEK